MLVCRVLRKHWTTIEREAQIARLRFAAVLQDDERSKLTLYDFNLNYFFAEGMLREKLKEVLMNCGACRTRDTMSTGENLIQRLIFDLGQGGDGGGEKDETKLSQL